MQVRLNSVAICCLGLMPWLPSQNQAQQSTNLLAHEGSVLSVAFSPNGNTLASGGSDCTIILWDTLSGKVCCTLKGHDNTVFSLAFSPDGKILASASGDR